MPGATFIEGRKVDLRTVERDDLEFLHRGNNHPSIARFLSGTPSNMPTIESEHEQQVKTDTVRLLVVPREGEFGDEPVGLVYMYVDDTRTMGIGGVWLLPEAQRQKFTQDALIHFIEYAFGPYGLHRIEVRTSEQNRVIQRLCDRWGFSHEGVIREREFRDGEYADLERYGLLVHEWPGKEPLLDNVFNG